MRRARPTIRGVFGFRGSMLPVVERAEVSAAHSPEERAGGEAEAAGELARLTRREDIGVSQGAKLLQQLGAAVCGDCDLVGATYLRGEAQMHPQELHFSRGPRGFLGLQLKAEEPHEAVEGAEP